LPALLGAMPRADGQAQALREPDGQVPGVSASQARAWSGPALQALRGVLRGAEAREARTTKERSVRKLQERTAEEKLALWGEGPWVNEPDRLGFEAHGLACLLVRNEFIGCLLGYVGVPRSHPLHGAGYDDERLHDVYVHGGLTYSNVHPGLSPEDELWWFGFDAAHAWDLAPGLRDIHRKARAALSAQTREMLDDLEIPELRQDVYRDLPYMQAQCVELAAQLARLGAQDVNT
jgi:hypothetical protein